MKSLVDLINLGNLLKPKSMENDIEMKECPVMAFLCIKTVISSKLKGTTITLHHAILRWERFVF